MSPTFQSYLEKQYVSNIKKFKRIIVKAFMTKILFCIFALTIFSIPLLLSPIPKNIEAQKAESEIEEEICISYNKSEKLISINCKYANFEDISKQITNPEIIKLETPTVSNNNNNNNNNNNSNNNKNEKVWLLNAGLKVEENALLDINSNDVTWLKIVPTKKSLNAITVDGSLKVDSHPNYVLCSFKLG